MKFTTKTSLITEVEQRLYQVSGTGVQIYSEDVIVKFLQHKLDMLFSKRFWAHFCQWHTLTLVGSGGAHDFDFSASDVNVKHFTDIRVVYRENSDRPLPSLNSRNRNPYNITGDTPRYVEPLATAASSYATKLFRVWPLTATGTLYVHARTYPSKLVDIEGSAEVEFDADALALGAAWEYAEDDGTNPGAAQKLQTLFEQRVGQLEKDADAQPFELAPGSTDIPEQWFETGYLGS